MTSDYTNEIFAEVFYVSKVIIFFAIATISKGTERGTISRYYYTLTPFSHGRNDWKRCFL